MIAIINDALLSNANAGGNLTSSACNISRMTAFSLQSISTGTANGTIKVQVSNDPPSEGTNAVIPSNWTDLPGATIAMAAASIQILARTSVSYNWLQVIYTRTGGAGTLTVNIKAQEI